MIQKYKYTDLYTSEQTISHTLHFGRRN